MTFEAHSTLIENDIYRVYDDGGDLVKEHKATGAKFYFDVSEDAWVPAQGLHLDGANITGVGDILAEKFGTESDKAEEVNAEKLTAEVLEGAGVTVEHIHRESGDGPFSFSWEHPMDDDELDFVLVMTEVRDNDGDGQVILSHDAIETGDVDYTLLDRVASATERTSEDEIVLVEFDSTSTDAATGVFNIRWTPATGSRNHISSSDVGFRQWGGKALYRGTIDTGAPNPGDDEEWTLESSGGSFSTHIIDLYRIIRKVP